MEKKRKAKIRKWDEVSQNPMKGIEDMLEQNDNQLDGVINNLPEPKPVCQVNSDEVIEEEQRKKSVLKKLQEADLPPERGKPASRCTLCADLEGF